MYEISLCFIGICLAILVATFTVLVVVFAIDVIRGYVKEWRDQDESNINS